MDPSQKTVKEIFFKIGGYFGGFHKVLIRETDLEHFICAYHTEWGHDADSCSIKPFGRDAWNSLLRYLFVNQKVCSWNNEYINPDELDGTEWCLGLTYSDDSTFSSEGSNDYPPVFDKLERKFERLYRETINNQLPLHIQQQYPGQALHIRDHAWRNRHSGLYRGSEPYGAGECRSQKVEEAAGSRPGGKGGTSTRGCFS